MASSKNEIFVVPRIVRENNPDTFTVPFDFALWQQNNVKKCKQ